jgi:hypothetical protein
MTLISYASVAREVFRKLLLAARSRSRSTNYAGVLSQNSFTHSFDLPEDLIGVHMPQKGFGITVAMIETVEYRPLQMPHSGVAAAPNASLGHFCE